MAQAGFINGMPVKIRVIKDCIVITPQNTRELWGCIERMPPPQIPVIVCRTAPGNLHG
ncbi:SymE family type I addiction module toxin [Salmonella enterica]|nr:SymE family type I addiction module toxin [Salmonella enterica]EJJ3974598.1 SymE family type I addiction module toxin [Salmonella enterica]EJJ3983031.1 SymE family type I addiction module toxin [Salmonella enterica]EJJ3997246.1 SymE family type I addiction module toxin [Salmonella enterica]EJJ4131216.1 SymE family type I addiction module toxin [Salmonella enterica]